MLMNSLKPERPTNVSAVAFSVDGTLLAVGSEDGAVRFWNLPDRTYRGALRWQTRMIFCMSFSPDGTLAVGVDGGMVYQFRPGIPQEPGTLQPALVSQGGLAWSPQGDALAVADRDGTVQLLDGRTGLVRTTLKGAVNPAMTVVFSPDGRTIATRTWGGAIALWDTETGKPTFGPCYTEIRTLAFSPRSSVVALGRVGVTILDRSGALQGTIGNNREIKTLAFSPDGRTLAVLDRDNNLELWDLSGGWSPRAPAARARPEGEIHCLAFLPDGTLLTGDQTAKVRFWKTAGDLLTANPKQLQWSGPVKRLQVFSDGRGLLVQGSAGDVELWDLKSLSRRTRVYLGDRDLCASVLPDGSSLVVRSSDGIVQVWDCQTWTARLLPGQPLWPVYSLALTPDGDTLITGSGNRLPGDAFRAWVPVVETLHDIRPLQSPAATMRFWNPDTGKEQPGLTGPATMAPPELVALSPERRILAAGGRDGSVQVWDRTTGCQVTRLFVGRQARGYVPGVETLRHLTTKIYPRYPESLRSLAFSPDGRLLATASSQGELIVWDTDRWEEIQTLSLDAAGPLWVAFSPAGDLILPRGGQIRFLDPRSGQQRLLLGEEDSSQAVGVAFNPQGRLLAVACQDRCIRLWDFSTRKLLHELPGHMDRISSLAFSPDGKTLASGSYDRTVKLWCVAAAAEVASLEAHHGRVHCLTFSRDGTLLVTGGESGSGQGEVFLWRAPREPGTLKHTDTPTAR